jgi:hypothetical protein
MNKYQQQLLDSYEAEIVEDIPERFDLSRYKNASVLEKSSRTTSLAAQTQLQSQQTTHIQTIPQSGMSIYPAQNYPFHSNQQRILFDQMTIDRYPQNHLMTNSNKTLGTFGQPNYINQFTSSLSDYPVMASANYMNLESANTQVILNPPHQLQQQQAQLVSYSTLPIPSKKNQEEIPNTTLPSSSCVKSNGFSEQTLVRKKDQKASKYLNDTQLQQHSDFQNSYDEENWSTLPTQNKTLSSYKNSSSSGNSSGSEASGKKHSYNQDIQQKLDGYDRHEDERQRDHYSKASSTIPRRAGDEQEYLYGRVRKRSSSRDHLDIHYTTSESQPISTPSINIQPTKSNLKNTGKKPGVTFDEKLEVYEVKNPHYGLDVKSEKREQRKKKKDKQKEEELIQKLKYEMKAKVQTQNMIHYYVSLVVIFFVITY